MRKVYICLICSLLALYCSKSEEKKPVSLSLEQDVETKDTVVTNVSERKKLTVGPHIVSAPSGLMLRSEPTRESPAIVKMLKDMKVEVLEYSSKEDEYEGNRARWAKVKYKKYTGWAFSYYLKPEKGAKVIE